MRPRPSTPYENPGALAPIPPTSDSDLARRIEKPLLWGYQCLTAILIPILIILALPYLLLNRKRRKTLLPRLGFCSYPKGKSEPLWIHALSVGEVLSASRLIHELRQQTDDHPLYLSVSTRAGYDIASAKLGDNTDALFYFPHDIPFIVNRCVRKIRPALFLLIETDIWPGFMAEIKRRGIPCLLLNGRLSNRTFRAYQRFWPLFRPALRSFRRIHPQSQFESDRFLALGIPPESIGAAGNLKFDAVPPVCTAEETRILKSDLCLDPSHPVLLAGSTHGDEDPMILSVYHRLLQVRPNLKLIMVPRHPHRAQALRGEFEKLGLHPQFYSRPRKRGWAVLIVDSIGHLSRLYAVADLAFVGGSLVPHGGQNPIEPAAQGVPILFGPDMSDFPDLARWLLEAGGAIRIHSAEELHDECRKLLGDPERSRCMGEQARTVVLQHRGATQTIIKEIQDMLSTIK